jgi:hypothetical protein
MGSPSLRRALRAATSLIVAITLAGSGAVAATAATGESPSPTAVASASLSGTVTDAATGSGIAGASVVVIAADGSEAGSATAGSTGGYTVSGLVAGDYRVSISSAPAYDPVFWPSAGSLDAAQAVTLAEGQAYTGADAALQPVAVVPVAEAPVEEAEPSTDSTSALTPGEGGDAEAKPTDRTVAVVRSVAIDTLPEDDPGTASIFGVVTSADTGEPVEGALVSLGAWMFEGRTTETRSDGSYEFTGLLEKQYHIAITPPADSGLLRWGLNGLIPLNAGQHLELNQALELGGAISGRVRYDGPEYAWGTIVATGDAGVFSASFYASPEGSYLIDGLPSGDYIVQAWPNGDTEHSVARQFYRDANSIEDADSVSVVAGQSASDIDFNLVEGVQIEGTMTAADPVNGSTGIQPIEATAYRWNGTAWNAIQSISGWGDYSFSAWVMSGPSRVLPPGTYTVGFEYPGHCTQYWDSKSTLATADTFALASGETRSGINAALRKDCEALAVTPGEPSISGTPQVGKALTVSPGTWEPAPVELSYQWLADDEPIVGATGEALTLTDAQEGATISVVVTGSRPGYESATATSDVVGPVSAEARIVPGTPTISGDPVTGEVLTAHSGDWSPGDVDFTYQWLADGDPIPAATGETLVPGEGEVGSVISVRVTGSKEGFASATATSFGVGPITSAPLLDLTVGEPSISGIPQVGETLTVAPGTWGPAPVTLSYQWLVDGVPVASATAPTLVLDASTAGKKVSAVVRGSKPGYNPAQATADEVGPIALGELSTALPTIDGTPRVGEVLTAHAGTWGPEPVALAFQWLADGEPIEGATGPEFEVGPAQLGATISVTVTGAKPGYAEASDSSEATDAVSPGVLTTVRPTVSGKPGVGETLTVEPGAWSPAPVSFAYQWLADGEPIEGAADASITVPADLVGAALSVRVTGSREGFDPAEEIVDVGEVAPSVTLSTSRAVPGAAVTVTGQYFLPGEEVLLELHSTPLELATVTTDDTGGFTTVVTIPAGSALGEHEIVAVGKESERSGSATIEIYDLSAPPTTPPGSPTQGDLAITGAAIPIGILALGLLLVSAGLFVARRRVRN